MRASGLVLWGSLSALAFASTAGGCGGRAEIGVPDRGADDGGSSGSSSGVAGSSSGFSGSSSGFSGSSSGMDGSSSGSGSGSSSGFSGSSSGISGSSTGSSSGVSGSSSGGAYGTIDLEECLTSLCASQSFQVYAEFGTGNSPCTSTTTGACIYYSCSGGTTGPGVSAGTLTVSSPWLTTPVSIPYGGTLYQYTSSSPGFNAGQTVTVTASGDSVPAFGPVSVGAPDLTELVQPPVTTDGGITNISTVSDLPVQWTGGQPGATMILEAFGNTNAYDYTICTWNGSDGKGVVPAAALKPFSGTTGAFYYGQYNVTSFSAGPYAITLTALPFAAGNVSFQ